MLKQYFKIDEYGYFREIVVLKIFEHETTNDEGTTEKSIEISTIYGDILNEIPENYVEIPPPSTIYPTIWNGSEWVKSPYIPEYDEETEIPVWSEENDAWEIKKKMPAVPANDLILESEKQLKLTENSTICEQIIINEFKSAVKGDGLQPYRMNEHDQINLSGMQGMINTLLITGKEMPLFSWQNANQTVCDDDWHYSQILKLISDFGTWKMLILKRQDEIKECILNAQTVEDINNIEIDYSDLLDFRIHS